LFVCLFVCLFVLEPCAEQLPRRVSIVVNISQQFFGARLHLQVAGIVHEAAVVVNDSASNDFKAAGVISEAAGIVHEAAGVISEAAGGVKACIAVAYSDSETTGHVTRRLHQGRP
jgi:hypothetical protein